MLAGKDWKDFQSCFKIPSISCFRIVLHVLDGSGVTFWNTSGLLARNYIEKCQQSAKLSRNNSFTSSALWNCHDQIHLGFTYLLQFNQLIINSLCNDYPDKLSHYNVQSCACEKFPWKYKQIFAQLGFTVCSSQWLQNSEPLLGLACLRSVDSGSLGIFIHQNFHVRMTPFRCARTIHGRATLDDL
jgi:hypothetical protein